MMRAYFPLCAPDPAAPIAKILRLAYGAARPKDRAAVQHSGPFTSQTAPIGFW
jgi:hypothetical protein